MTQDAVNREPNARRAKWFSALWVTSLSIFAAVALWGPRGVKPGRLPVLQLDPTAVQEALQADRVRASEPPQGDAVGRLRALYADVGRAAYEGLEDVSQIRERYKRVDRLTRAVESAQGRAALWAMRAQVANQLWDALEKRLPETRQQELLGDFPEQLRRYGVRDAEGRLRAPPLVAHAMFKARWNVIHGLGATQGFAPVEIQAYEGWLALHGEGAPEPLRLGAARRFATAGGAGGHEAVAVWSARLGHFDEARKALQLALAEHRSVRLRNYAIALSGSP